MADLLSDILSKVEEERSKLRLPNPLPSGEDKTAPYSKENNERKGEKCEKTVP